MKIEVEKVRGEDAWIVRLDEEQEQRFRHLALCANTEIAGVIVQILTDAIGFSMAIMEAKHGDIREMIREVGQKIKPLESPLKSDGEN